MAHDMCAENVPEVNFSFSKVISDSIVPSILCLIYKRSSRMI